MAHPTEAWKHSEFKEIISKVGASELYYKALQVSSAPPPFFPPCDTLTCPF
jgi:hypothetical protein